MEITTNSNSMNSLSLCSDLLICRDSWVWVINPQNYRDSWPFDQLPGNPILQTYLHGLSEMIRQTSIKPFYIYLLCTQTKEKWSKTHLVENANVSTLNHSYSMMPGTFGMSFLYFLHQDTLYFQGCADFYKPQGNEFLISVTDFYAAQNSSSGSKGENRFQRKWSVVFDVS